MAVTIRVHGAWAEIHGVGTECLEACLAVLDPDCRFNRAYREGRWDGMVRLYEGRQFPAGLVQHVTEYLNSTGHDVRLVEPTEKVPIDTARFQRDYLPGITLWEHQYEAALKMLTTPRGTVRVPTGGGKTELVAAGARYLWEERDWRSVIVVPKKGLLKQTVDRLEKYYQGDIRIGMYGDGARAPGDIVVGTAQTLISFRSRKRRFKGKGIKILPVDKEIREMLRSYEVLWLDEVHHASSSTWVEIAQFSRALRRYGLSGTPLKKEDLADMQMIGSTGPLIYECDTQALIDDGLAAKPRICMIVNDAISGERLPEVWKVKIDEQTGKPRRIRAPLPYQEAYEKGVVENASYNHAVIRAAAWLVDNHRQTLILCRRKKHWNTLRELLDDAGVNYMAVWGATQTPERDEAKRLFDERKISLILASTIFDEGEDLPGIEAIVLAEGVKVETNVIQRIGRGMRKKKDGENEVWIVDFVPTCHDTLIKHAIARMKAYESDGHEVRLWEEKDWIGEGEDDKYLLPFLKWENT